MRYYFGDRTVSLIISAPVVVPPVVKTDWPLFLVSADENGSVTYRVPCLDPSLFAAPSEIVAAYVPGATLDPSLTGDQVLALPGVLSVSTPFPPSFGAVGLDQTVTVTIPGPLPVGPVVVVLLGRVA